MRFLITTQVFPPELHPTAVMVRDLARTLVVRGHDVTVACGYPHHPAGRLLGGYRKRALLRETLEGFEVVRGWHFTSERRSIVARSIVMTTQALGIAAAALLGWGKPDVVISIGPPLLGPLLAAAVARLFRASLVTVIYDIYPDVAIETGKVRNSLVIAAARWAERRTYAVSDKIIVLSEGFRRTLQGKGVEAKKLAIVPVWLDPDEIRPGPRDNKWRAEQGISPDTFVVLHAGTIGLVSGAEVMVKAAERLLSEPEFLLLFVGDGQLKAEIEARVRSLGLTNVKFLPLQDRSRLNEVQATADASVVTLAPGRGRTSVPSKVVGYMAAGRPIIASVDDNSDTAACVRNGPCGLVVSPGDADGIVAAVRALKHDPERRVALGRAARVSFEAEFGAPMVLERFLSLLEALPRAKREDR